MDTEVGVMLGCKPRNVGSFLKARKPKEIDSSFYDFCFFTEVFPFFSICFKIVYN